MQVCYYLLLVISGIKQTKELYWKTKVGLNQIDYDI